MTSREVIESRLKEIGKSKTWLAGEMGMSIAQLSHLINKTSDPRIKTALKISVVLETTVEEIWGE
jgi:plasmid maintenance system antidote protein VapI